MTNEVAVNVLRIMASGIELKGYTEYWLSSFKEAYEMAIKVLEERPQGEWIPVSERLPDNETEVLIQYGQSILVGYHMWDFTVYPSEFADGNETGWYDCKDDFICGSDEVTAWQSLPEPYKKGGAEYYG